MKFKKTRIAFTALCGILCMLLIAFWVRSYRVRDWLILPSSSQADVFTMRGTIKLRYLSSIRQPRRTWWKHSTEPTRGLDDLLDVPFLRAKAARHWCTLYGPHFGFAYERSADGFAHEIYVRMWALATLLTLAGLIPWIPWQPWPWHFSLKALLLTTLIALILGKIIYVDPM